MTLRRHGYNTLVQRNRCNMQITNSVCGTSNGGLYILKGKSFATLTKMLVPFSDPNNHLVIMQLTSPFICLAYNAKIRMVWLMIAELRQ